MRRINGFVDAVEKKGQGVWVVLHFMNPQVTFTISLFLFSASFDKSLIYTTLNSL